MGQWLQDAHQAGFDANYDGVLLRDNPFGEQTPAHDAWATGHAQAQQTRDEWEAWVKTVGYHYFDGDTFEREGHTFRVTHPYDDSGDTPWERADGHGPVSDWTRNAKQPGQRVLCSDRSSHRYYDWQAACKLARRDGWDADPIGAPNRIERAVQADFDFLKAWCDNEWQYIGVVVELLDANGDSIDKDSLWGIESNAYDYLRDTAHELADQLLHAHGLTLAQRTQAWRDALREARERRYWAQRDTITV